VVAIDMVGVASPCDNDVTPAAAAAAAVTSEDEDALQNTMESPRRTAESTRSSGALDP